MKRSSGIALLEVLMSVAILSAGLISIYQPLLSSLSALAYADYRMEASRLMSNQIWEWKQASYQTRILPGPSSGILLGRDKTFEFKALTSLLPSERGLTQVDFVVNWQAGGQSKQVKRSLYVTLPYEAKA